MNRKFKQILEGKYRNKTYSKIPDSTAYLIVHEICLDKLMSASLKMEVIDRFCHDELTVQDLVKYFKQENYDL